MPRSSIFRSRSNSSGVDGSCNKNCHKKIRAGRVQRSIVNSVYAVGISKFPGWLKNLPGYDEIHRDPAELYGTDDRHKQAAVIKKISVISLVSADDPPTFMSYGMAPGDPVPKGDRAEGWKVHHVNFGIALKKRLDALGVEADLHYPGADSKYDSAADFFIRKFGKR